MNSNFMICFLLQIVNFTTADSCLAEPPYLINFTFGLFLTLRILCIEYKFEYLMLLESPVKRNESICFII